MFLHILSIFGVSSTIAAVISVPKSEKLNNFEISGDGVYSLRDKSIPILREGAIANIDSMKTLRLYDDKIEEIRPGAFQNLPNLQELDIYQNKIERIEPGVFNNLNVIRLDLSANGISTIDSRAFDNMANLLFINLANNQLREWDVDWFAKTPSLRNIHLSNNYLEEIPANVIGHHEGTPDNPFNIFLESNNIERIDADAFKNLKIITVLSLGSNQIKTLDGDFLCGLQINELYLNFNKIQCLDSDDFEKIFVANLTQVIDNPWDADCLENAKQWAQSHQKNVQFSL